MGSMAARGTPWSGQYGRGRLDGAAEELGRTVGVGSGEHSNRQCGDMSKGIEIGGAGAVANQEPFQTRGFEAGIVALTLST